MLVKTKHSNAGKVFREIPNTKKVLSSLLVSITVTTHCSHVRCQLEADTLGLYFWKQTFIKSQQKYDCTSSLLASIPLVCPVPSEILGSWYPGALRGCSTGKGLLTQQFWSMGYKIKASQSAWGNSPVFSGWKSQPCARYSPKCPLGNVSPKAVTWLQEQILVRLQDNVVHIPHRLPEWKLKGTPRHHHIGFIFLCKAPKY